MTKNTKVFILLFFIGISWPCLSQNLWQPYYIYPRSGDRQIDLSQNWELTHLDKAVERLDDLANVKEWLLVKEPTSVQMAYYRSGKLPNPYEHLNSEQYLWMEKKVWYYKKKFDVDQTVQDKNVILSFDGLDYFSRIWLNGELLGYHEGMWSGPAIDISEDVKAGENELLVEIKSGNYDQWDTFNWRHPGKIIKSRTFARGSSHKPFFALGMWKGARINILPAVHLERPYLVTKSISENKATVSVSVELFTTNNTFDYQLHPWEETQISNYSNIELAPKNIVVEPNLEFEVIFSRNGKEQFKKTFKVEGIRQRSWIEKDIELDNPTLWQINGLGEAHLYEVALVIKKQDKLMDQISIPFGIRTVEQERTTGVRTTDRWKDWQFVINGKPVFLKGVNWMAMDPLYDFPKENYEWLLDVAQAAGIQIIRIWGGSLLETEDFYNACNQRGILVWQDFPKNNNETPEWPQDVWEAQVMHNIYRLRNHPSLAVWCGGNEFNPYTRDNTVTVSIMERSLQDFDPSRMFIRTSPDHGSTHLYPDFDPTWYKKKLDLIPYVAETGIHSIPEPVSLYEVVKKDEFSDLGKMNEESFKDTHPEFIHHFMEYYPSRVPRMLSRASHIIDIKNPTIAEISEATQVGAGEFYQVLSEGIQANYPITTGLMPWVYKRTWPTVAAIHLLDGFGQPSAPYYFLKRTYEPVHVAIDIDRMLWKAGEEIEMPVKIMNAKEKGVNNAKVTVQVYDDNFKVLKSEDKTVSVEKGTSVTSLNMSAFKIDDNYKDRFLFLMAELKENSGKLISRSVYNLRSLKIMEEDSVYQKYTTEPTAWITLNNGPWLKPKVAATATALSVNQVGKAEHKDGRTTLALTIENNGKVPAFMTKIDVVGAKRLFMASDNYFWLAPGELKEVKVEIMWRELIMPAKADLVVIGWNSKKQIMKIR